MVTKESNTNEQPNSHKLWLQFGIRIRYQIINETLFFLPRLRDPPRGWPGKQRVLSSQNMKIIMKPKQFHNPNGF